MRYLIDTNVLIHIAESGYISDDVRAIFDDYENAIFVSSENVKEFVHLIQEGRVILNKHYKSLNVFDLIENEFGLSIKFVTKEHLRTFANLELVEGHRDPNDRLIIAQAITEKMPLISNDTKFPKYTRFGLDFIPNR